MGKRPTDAIDEAYGNAIGALKLMRQGYRTVAALPDEECDAAERLRRNVMIESHGEYITKLLEMSSRFQKKIFID